MARLNSRLKTAEERVTELAYRLIELIHFEEHREKLLKNKGMES